MSGSAGFGIYVCWLLHLELYAPGHAPKQCNCGFNVKIIPFEDFPQRVVCLVYWLDWLVNHLLPHTGVPPPFFRLTAYQIRLITTASLTCVNHTPLGLVMG
ncbi:MAG: hypothetical protein JO235_17125 [Chroococcidiopsidaceae cyanobacterium CP_BM_RX_35]|nr:hypothetical protein [Chroococcidiopsidaceae cyanobacterium CP_BM_RX_35]